MRDRTGGRRDVARYRARDRSGARIIWDRAGGLDHSYRAILATCHSSATILDCEEARSSSHPSHTGASTETPRLFVWPSEPRARGRPIVFRVAAVGRASPSLRISLGCQRRKRAVSRLATLARRREPGPLAVAAGEATRRTSERRVVGSALPGTALGRGATDHRRRAREASLAGVGRGFPTPGKALRAARFQPRRAHG
jgi:hypothetical protein